MQALERGCQMQNEWGRSFVHSFFEVGQVAVVECEIVAVGAAVAVTGDRSRELAVGVGFENKKTEKNERVGVG